MEKTNFRIPKTSIGEKTFKRIITTGKKLFAKNGYQATSINDVILKSKVAAGTFYIYFDSKLALYLYILEDYRHKIREASSEAIRGLKTRAEIERAGLKAFILYVRKDPLAYKVVWESLFVDQKIFKEYYESFSLSYQYHLKKFVENGEVRNDINLETLSYILMGISNFVGLQILFKESVSDEEVDFVVEESMKILQSGMFL